MSNRDMPRLVAILVTAAVLSGCDSAVRLPPPSETHATNELSETDENVIVSLLRHLRNRGEGGAFAVFDRTWYLCALEDYVECGPALDFDLLDAISRRRPALEWKFRERNVKPYEIRQLTLDHVTIVPSPADRDAHRDLAQSHSARIQVSAPAYVGNDALIYFRKVDSTRGFVWFTRGTPAWEVREMRTWVE